MSIQLVQPDLSVIGRITWCLEYVRKQFGRPVVENSAWEAWEATQYKHTNRDMPDVAVPVWFSYRADLGDGLKNYGHVVTWVPDKGFYSSPWDRKVGYNILNSIESVEQHYSTAPKTANNGKVQFVGWSEDISNVRVAIIEGDNKMVRETVNWIYRGMLNREPTEAELKQWVGGDALLLSRLLANDKQNETIRWKATTYDQAVKDAFEKGKAEGDSDNFIETKVYIKK